MKHVNSPLGSSSSALRGETFPLHNWCGATLMHELLCFKVMSGYCHLVYYFCFKLINKIICILCVCLLAIILYDITFIWTLWAFASGRMNQLASHPFFPTRLFFGYSAKEILKTRWTVDHLRFPRHWLLTTTWSIISFFFLLLLFDFSSSTTGREGWVSTTFFYKYILVFFILKIKKYYFNIFLNKK
jgi:hypothetical protein